MISRVWSGRTAAGNADAYERFLREEVFPGIEGRVGGFRGSYVLRRPLGDVVEFVVITVFDSMAAIRQFAGVDYELAVIEPEAQKLLEQADERARHFETTAFGERSATPSSGGRPRNGR